MLNFTKWDRFDADAAEIEVERQVGCSVVEAFSKSLWIKRNSHRSIFPFFPFFYVEYSRCQKTFCVLRYPTRVLVRLPLAACTGLRTTCLPRERVAPAAVVDTLSLAAKTCRFDASGVYCFLLRTYLDGTAVRLLVQKGELPKYQIPSNLQSWCVHGLSSKFSLASCSLHIHMLLRVWIIFHSRSEMA